MEHRWSVRKRIRGPVRIECPDLGPIDAKLRDIGLGGMRVEQASSPLPLYRLVKVAFALPHDGLEQAFGLDALVVRSTGAGAALMFVDASAGTIERLRHALYQPRVFEAREPKSAGWGLGGSDTAAGGPQG